MCEKSGWNKLTTALYLLGDSYEISDAGFQTRQSLVVDLGQVDEVMAR